MPNVINDPSGVQYTVISTSPGNVTNLTLTAPSPNSGQPGSPSNPFTVGVNPLNGSLQGITCTVTPHVVDSGGNAVSGATFSPATIEISDTQKSATFTMTPPAGLSGIVTVSITHTETGG